MKKTTAIRLGFLAGILACSAASGQVFNVHDINQNFVYYGGYNVCAYGQGAYSDPGNNIWNGFGNGGPPGNGWSFGNGLKNDPLVPGNPGNPYAWAHSFFASGPNLFNPASSGAPNAGNATSAGQHTPITLPIMTYGFDTLEGVTNGFGTNDGTLRTNVAAWIFQEAAVVTAASPGAGTAANPFGSLTLSNVPVGTYDLYLYSANSNGTGGASFIASSGTPKGGVYTAINPNPAGSIGYMRSFIERTNYIVYNNVVPNADSTIVVTWGAVTNPISGVSGEADFNGLQLATSSPVSAAPTLLGQPADAFFSQGTTATLMGDARGYPALAYQWYSGSPPGTLVAGQTGAALTFANAQASQSGSYYFVATNLSGAVTSAVAHLTVAAGPLIMGQSSTNPITLYSGHNHFSMSVNALGQTPLYYFWRANGVTKSVTTNSGAISFTNITATANYDCVVSNSYSTAQTVALPVTIVPAPTAPYPAALLALNPFAYWPLTETSGSTAYDYENGNNGTLQGTVAMGGQGPTNGFGASSFAYQFDGLSSYVDVPGASLNFLGSESMVVWVIGGGSGFQTVAGRGDTSYRINMDGGAGGTAHFASGNGPDAIGGPRLSSLSLGSSWHQIAGVYDAGSSNIYLYVDGVLVNSQVVGPTPGNSRDFWIGGAPDYNNRFFGGANSAIAHVALFNYPLSGSQVQSLYNAGGLPPAFVTNPTNFDGYVGGSATFYVNAEGAAPLSYQWTGPGGVIPGATNATLVVTNLNSSGTPANSGPGQYFCTVTNASGSLDSYQATLTVSASSPFIVQDLPSTVYALAGATASLSVQAGGNQPFTNQWYYGSTALHDGDRGGRVSGTTNLTLNIANVQPSDDGAYQVYITNGVPPYYTSSSVGNLVVQNEPLFNGNGAGWTMNGGPALSSDVLTLTDGANSETRSIWYDTPLYVGAFKASFTYQATPSTPGGGLADGVTFCIQNSPAGVSALGGGGGELAYFGIVNSVALAIDLYNARGYQFVVGGANPSTGTYTVTAPTVDTGSGNPINVNLLYNGATLSLSLTDTKTGGTVSTNLVVGSIPSYAGTNTAFVGFTGATGGVNSIQTISNFSFIPLPALSVTRNAGNLLLSWPLNVGAFQLQQNSSLTNPSGWTTVAGPYNVVGSSYQVTQTLGTGPQYYRLVVTP